MYWWKWRSRQRKIWSLLIFCSLILNILLCVLYLPVNAMSSESALVSCAVAMHNFNRHNKFLYLFVALMRQYIWCLALKNVRYSISSYLQIYHALSIGNCPKLHFSFSSRDAWHATLQLDLADRGFECKIALNWDISSYSFCLFHVTCYSAARKKWFVWKMSGSIHVYGRLSHWRPYSWDWVRKKSSLIS